MPSGSSRYRHDVDTGELVARRDAGASIRQLAYDYDMSRTSIRQRLRGASSGGKSTKTAAKDIDTDTLVARYQCGESMYRLSREFAVNKARIRTVLINAGVTLRPARASPEPKNARVQGPDEQATNRAVFTRWQQGFTIVAIATEFGIRRADVRQRLSASGVVRVALSMRNRQRVRFGGPNPPELWESYREARKRRAQEPAGSSEGDDHV